LPPPFLRRASALRSAAASCIAARSSAENVSDLRGFAAVFVSAISDLLTRFGGLGRTGAPCPDTTMTPCRGPFRLSGAKNLAGRVFGAIGANFDRSPLGRRAAFGPLDRG